MRLVVQRVSQARVDVDGQTVGSVGAGLVILIGIATGDTPEQAKTLADKVADLRIFPNEEGKMDRSLKDVDGGALVVSQFTLYGDCSKGRRPNFTQAAKADEAEALYETFCHALRDTAGIKVATGKFGAMMELYLVNDGPVTLILE